VRSTSCDLEFRKNTFDLTIFQCRIEGKTHDFTGKEISHRKWPEILRKIDIRRLSMRGNWIMNIGFDARLCKLAT
jgi:hypothetical protein